MSQSDNPDLDALNELLSALTDVMVLIHLIRDHVAGLMRLSRDCEFQFDTAGKFMGFRFNSRHEEFYPADGEYCFEINSHCEWLPKYISDLHDALPKLNATLDSLPGRLAAVLDALTESPWVASARRHCVDRLLLWPCDDSKYDPFNVMRLSGRLPDILKHAADSDPLPTWFRYVQLIEGYKSDAFAIRREVVSPSSEVHPATDDPDRASLGSKSRQALEIIEKDGPLSGKVLATRMKVEETTLRKHYLPPLRPFGLKNDRSGDGYYISRESET